MRIETRWYTDGVQGLVERIVAPAMLRKVYREELRLLDRYATRAAQNLEPALQGS